MSTPHGHWEKPSLGGINVNIPRFAGIAKLDSGEIKKPHLE
jgi:hypothetical protein